MRPIQLRRSVAGGLAAVAVLLAAVSPASPQALPQTPGQPSPSPPAQVAPQSPAQPAPQGGPQPQSPPALQPYAVQPGDVLNISVLGEPELSGPVTVAPDGSIVLQLVGRIQASGLTLPALTARLRDALRRFVREPQVAISIRQTATHQEFVYLLGQVSRPGAYEMRDGWTVAALIAAAGGPTSEAALQHAFVVRQDARIPVDLQQIIAGDMSANVQLEPGDLIVVPETQERILVMGQVGKPGPYAFKSGDRLIDVLSAAGGTTSQAALNDVGVIRRTGQGSKPVVTHADLNKFYKSGDGNQNIALQPGDVVYVPAKGVSWVDVLGALGSLTWLVTVF